MKLGCYKLAACLIQLIIIFCFFEEVLYRRNAFFNQWEEKVLSLQPFLLAFLIVYSYSLVFFTFRLSDCMLIFILFYILTMYFLSEAAFRSNNALMLAVGMAFGRTLSFFFSREKVQSKTILICLLVLLIVSSLFHFDNISIAYHGKRWTGPFDDPNTYGTLMAVGVVLAVGILKASVKFEAEDRMRSSSLQLILFITAGMMAVGLVMSYSRGAWMGVAVGLFYLAWAYGKLKLKLVLPAVLVATAVVCLCWKNTADDTPWYVKRLDLGRPSAQNRLQAWRGAAQMMWDHPLGVGWNNAITFYRDHYSPPEGGPGALSTNDYLMIGTELGVPGLLCFVGYVGLCFRRSPRPLILTFSPKGEKESSGSGEVEALRAACLAGALVFVVTFWFDGGLFKLPTAAVFWVLLELGAGGRKEDGGERIEDGKDKTISA
jgi:O-antigen ligase